MTQEEIKNYNRLCAEFLDYIIKSKNEWYNYEQAWLPKGKTHYALEQLKFHSDWNWIMEVVEAIEKLKYCVNVTFHSKSRIHSCCVYNEKGELISMREGNRISKKEAVVQSINQFLIWYNETSNQK